MDGTRRVGRFARGQLCCVCAVVCVYKNTQTLAFAFSCYAWVCPFFSLCFVVLFVDFGGQMGPALIGFSMFVVG